MPQYKTHAGTLFPVPGIKDRECPRSTLEHHSPQSTALVNLYVRSKNLNEQGVTTYPAGNIPIPLADAFIILQQEEAKYESALTQYENLDAKNRIN